MKLSTRCRYGTRALIHIACRYRSGPTKRKDISRYQDISEGYLENILSMLKARGLLSSQRGAEGGFSLKKPPSQITLLEIVTALEGSISPVACVSELDDCSRRCDCGAHKAWMMLHEAQVETLRHISLQDLVDMQADSQTADFVI